jgi:hypothetical protein
VENQENVRSYVKVMVRNNLLSVENIRSGTCAAPNARVSAATSTGAARTEARARLGGRFPGRQGRDAPARK